MSRLCIWCGKQGGPFNKEHVFPYSLGGGEWTLRELVCQECNTVFSSYERELARRSVEALGRVAYGPAGRHRSASGRRVPLYAAGIYYLPQKGDLIYEGGLELGFKPYIRPQIILDSGDRGQITGGRKEELEKLVARLKRVVSARSFGLTVAVPMERGERYRVQRLTIGDGAQASAEGVAIRSDRPGEIALENFGGEGRDKHRPTPRVFLDDEDRLVLRAATLDEGVAFLGFVAHALSGDGSPRFSAALSRAQSGQTEENPQFIIHQAFRPNHSCRAIAKIGVNLACHVFGQRFVRQDGVAGIKEFVLGRRDTNLGEECRHVGMGAGDSVFSNFRTPADRHWMMLYFSPPTLYFALRLYGTGGYVVKVGESKWWPEENAFVVCTVDYGSRRMKRLGLSEVLQSFKFPGQT